MGERGSKIEEAQSGYLIAHRRKVKGTRRRAQWGRGICRQPTVFIYTLLDPVIFRQPGRFGFSDNALM